MIPNLSICVPSFRTEKIFDLYGSIITNFHRPFELIVCGPKEPDYKPIDRNLIFIQDFGSPARCCNIAASHAKGKYITFIADDATYLNKSISRAIIKLEKREEVYGNSYHHVIVAKYVEGNMEWWLMTLGAGLEGATLNSGYVPTKFIPDHWLHFNSCYMHRDLFLELGGYDSSIFETPHFASSDLAARAQRFGCTTELMDEPTFVVTHEPGTIGSHGPIHFAHIADHQRYISIYNNSDSLNRTIIDFNNFNSSPEKWDRRT